MASPTSRDVVAAISWSRWWWDTPIDLTTEEEEILRSLAAERGEAVAEPGDGLLSRIRSAFR